MNKILIMYELRGDNPSYNYKTISETIEKKYPDYTKPMTSSYFIYTSSTPQEVYTYLSNYIDPDDYVYCDYISTVGYGIISTKSKEWRTKQRD